VKINEKLKEQGDAIENEKDSTMKGKNKINLDLIHVFK
jgi:hypothetical protein